MTAVYDRDYRFFVVTGSSLDLSFPSIEIDPRERGDQQSSRGGKLSIFASVAESPLQDCPLDLLRAIPVPYSLEHPISLGECH